MDVSCRTAAQAAQYFGSHEDEYVHGWMFAFFCPATVLFWERGNGDLVWSGLFQCGASVICWFVLCSSEVGQRSCRLRYRKVENVVTWRHGVV
jgi:hypothetical protein